MFQESVAEGAGRAVSVSRGHQGRRMLRRPASFSAEQEPRVLQKGPAAAAAAVCPQGTLPCQDSSAEAQGSAV